MSVFAHIDRKTTAEWLKLGYKPLKGGVGLKRHGREWFLLSQVESISKLHVHP